MSSHLLLCCTSKFLFPLLSFKKILNVHFAVASTSNIFSIIMKSLLQQPIQETIIGETSLMKYSFSFFFSNQIHNYFTYNSYIQSK